MSGLMDAMSPHLGKNGPKLCREIHLDPDMGLGSFYLGSIEISIVKMSSFIKTSKEGRVRENGLLNFHLIKKLGAAG